eukprot:c7592_g2_i2.p1 GENE.c7592_g2_i2~~c7592_g2_i2.p1  ORF type:complete len:379 (+),score=97.52 c7592_g2_i2:163-1137(+)
MPDASGRTSLSLTPDPSEIRDILMQQDTFDELAIQPPQTSTSVLPRNYAKVVWSELVFGDRIGSGGFGVVYKGTYFGRPVAIKKLTAADLPEDAMNEFRHEVDIMSNMKHPNILTLVAVSEEPSNMVIVSDLCDRKSLYHVLHDPNTKLNKRIKLKMALDAAMGMAHLHSKGIVHRDLKTLNLLVTEDFIVKVADFGLAKVKTITKSVMTGSIHVMGTVAYMAPELLMGKPFTEKVDVYAFGIVLWEILTRENPFNGMSQDVIFHGVKSGSLKPIIPPDCPQSYADLINDCLHVNPLKRPTFSEIKDRLKTIARPSRPLEPFTS